MPSVQCEDVVTGTLMTPIVVHVHFLGVPSDVKLDKRSFTCLSYVVGRATAINAISEARIARDYFTVPTADEQAAN
jgi:hypothetical protein